MKKWLTLFWIGIGCCVVLPAQNVGDNNTTTNTLALTTQERSQKSLSETIKRIDRKIDELYQKETVTPLNENELLRLDRLQEARMMMELRLKTGAGDMEKVKTLLKEAGEQEEANLTDTINQAKPTSSPSEDLLLSDLSESIPGKLVTKENEITNNPPESFLPQEPKTDSIETALNLSSDRLEVYRDMVTTSQKRTAEMDEKIAAIQKKIALLVDDTYPDYNAIYAETHDLTELLYDRTIEQVELRRDLKTILSPEQMKLWIAQSKGAKRTAAKKPVSAQTEEATDIQSILPEQISMGDEEGIVYVPMRLVPIRTEEGKKIYRAEPLKAN